MTGELVLGTLCGGQFACCAHCIKTLLITCNLFKGEIEIVKYSPEFETGVNEVHIYDSSH